ncbi:hypothetical protein SDA16_06955 [Legionella pneumophila serogroup 1]|uniref:Uncharacterized protein n=1 Tax=Legionella pneumophila TaxID=446 RepID=A0A140AYM2_LEGPN|nr:hypothetical protein [Legionella pneumophila]HCC3235843.1 hypothetical protein [Legionella pneumophila subsp. pneumophila]ALK43919.1 hypothetical protein [Legionella pneumophila]HAT2149825.1 hypothetical protein [Legionella pneumophila]HAT8621020.1 hypothetical protein [Legionella pneumophila]HAT8730850.1 hypothetical protein [Legionella pneumophila]
MNDEQRKNYCYLGDGVYAFFDGDGIWLRTGHHEAELCDDKIYLEPDVLESLNMFVEKVRQRNEISSEGVHGYVG